jgi:hypothetical protein
MDTIKSDNSNNINNFTDAGNVYYTNYLFSAKNLGIINGIGNNMFEPEKEITRQEMFVILYNTLKTIDEMPLAINDLQLLDFNDDNDIATWASKASAALVSSCVVSGSNNNLNPKLSTTRAEIAEILYNLLSK